MDDDQAPDVPAWHSRPEVTSEAALRALRTSPAGQQYALTRLSWAYPEQVIEYLDEYEQMLLGRLPPPPENSL